MPPHDGQRKHTLPVGVTPRTSSRPHRGQKPQQCAQVLPKATKTTLVMSGCETFWKHFFDLRYFEETGPAHPQAKELAEIIYKLMYDENTES